jgi:formiminoglutamase
MRSEYFEYIPFTNSDLHDLVSNRNGEKRIGEQATNRITNNTKFMLLGIEESIGPQANGGKSGAENAFKAFLERFLNMQSNEFLIGNEIFIAGRISLKTGANVPSDLSIVVNDLDNIVVQKIIDLCPSNLIPIVIGGGHNNAYPIAKAMNTLKDSAISVINLDPHADCRSLEGRHSGNPFSYAIKEGLIEKYGVIGLHKAYNNQFILDFLNQNSSPYTFFDNYISGKNDFQTDIETFVKQFQSAKFTGIELDMDAIAFSPSSAFSPSGLSVEQARYYVAKMAKELNPCYLHLPEAAPNNNSEELISGKILAYLVYDFIGNHNFNFS